MTVEIEWTYLIILAVAIYFALSSIFAPIIEMNPPYILHVLYLLIGAIISVGVFILKDVVVVNPKFGNLLLQTGIQNIILGVPLLRRPPIPALMPYTELELFVGTTSEESFRIASATLLLASFESTVLAILGSAIVFTAMHVYWQPVDWLYGMIGGITFSLLLMPLGSQTACILSHFMFDYVALGGISTTIYFIVSIVMSIVGGLLYLFQRGD